MGAGKVFSIPSKEGFTKIFSSPDHRSTSGVFVLLGKENNLNSPRMGIAIKKKDYRLATKRNMIKRNIRRSFVDSLPLLPSMDFVVLVKRSKSTKSENFKQELECLWGGLKKPK
ncbi:MAG: ribonuclease P protein component [Gammaproteobacteria bacterium]|nr:ribonuclease P protein component [Gammaproteobacteria bacterium]|tara:strand:+ start:68 stop:409 length:342 start_codon:yes stop_codon:yes gene_type:complete